MDSNKRKPQYSIDEKVLVCGWLDSNTGIIEDIKWIHHRRLQKDTWGYKIKYDNNKPVLSLAYVPEGYLRKLEQEL